MDTASLRRRDRASLWVILAVILLTSLPELLLTAADWGLIGSARWRPFSYQNAAFWAGLLHGWQPNYAAQPMLMFASYMVLHGGLMHLVSNMIVLALLGRIIAERTGPWGFLAVYVSSALGGSVMFGLLSVSAQPMVGASGALFGLLGAGKYWEWRERRATGAPLWPLTLSLTMLAVLNLAMWLALQGLLAWETHAGGFLAGWAIAAIWFRPSRAPS